VRRRLRGRRSWGADCPEGTGADGLARFGGGGVRTDSVHVSSLIGPQARIHAGLALFIVHYGSLDTDKIQPINVCRNVG